MADFPIILLLPLQLTLGALYYHRPFGQSLCKLNSTLSVLNFLLLAIITCCYVLVALNLRQSQLARFSWPFQILSATMIALCCCGWPSQVFRWMDFASSLDYSEDLYHVAVHKPPGLVYCLYPQLPQPSPLSSLVMVSEITCFSPCRLH